MVNTKQLTTEIKTLLEEIYNETKNFHPNEQTKQAELRTKINNLDLNEIENLADLTLQEKSTLLAEKSQLEKEKKEEKEKLDKELADTKEALATLKTQVSDKLTPELMAKLETLSNKSLELKLIPKKNADGTDMKDSEGNIIYEEILDLTELKTAIEDLKKAKTTEKPTNYWSVGACITGILGLGVSFFNLMSKQSKEKTEKELEIN